VNGKQVEKTNQHTVKHGAEELKSQHVDVVKAPGEAIKTTISEATTGATGSTLTRTLKTDMRDGSKPTEMLLSKLALGDSGVSMEAHEGINILAGKQAAGANSVLDLKPGNFKFSVASTSGDGTTLPGIDDSRVSGVLQMSPDKGIQMLSRQQVGVQAEQGFRAVAGQPTGKQACSRSEAESHDIHMVCDTQQMLYINCCNVLLPALTLGSEVEVPYSCQHEIKLDKCCT
jgi:hypothetical protein